MATVLAKNGRIQPVVVVKAQGALDAAGVCEYFGRAASNSCETIKLLKRQPNFPKAIKPWGALGQERWNIEELDEWRLNHCPRSGPWPTRKWAPTDPRRIRAEERRAVRAAAAAHSTTEAVQ